MHLRELVTRAFVVAAKQKKKSRRTTFRDLEYLLGVAKVFNSALTSFVARAPLLRSLCKFSSPPHLTYTVVDFPLVVSLLHIRSVSNSDSYDLDNTVSTFIISYSRFTILSFLSLGCEPAGVCGLASFELSRAIGRLLLLILVATISVL